MVEGALVCLEGGGVGGLGGRGGVRGYGYEGVVLWGVGLLVSWRDTSWTEMRQVK